MFPSFNNTHNQTFLSKETTNTIKTHHKDELIHKKNIWHSVDDFVNVHLNIIQITKNMVDIYSQINSLTLKSDHHGDYIGATQSKYIEQFDLVSSSAFAFKNLSTRIDIYENVYKSGLTPFERNNLLYIVDKLITSDKLINSAFNAFSEGAISKTYGKEKDETSYQSKSSGLVGFINQLLGGKNRTEKILKLQKVILIDEKIRSELHDSQNILNDMARDLTSMERAVTYHCTFLWNHLKVYINAAEVSLFKRKQELLKSLVKNEHLATSGNKNPTTYGSKFVYSLEEELNLIESYQSDLSNIKNVYKQIYENLEHNLRVFRLMENSKRRKIINLKKWLLKQYQYTNLNNQDLLKDRSILSKYTRKLLDSSDNHRYSNIIIKNASMLNKLTIKKELFSKIKIPLFQIQFKMLVYMGIQYTKNTDIVSLLGNGILTYYSNLKKINKKTNNLLSNFDTTKSLSSKLINNIHTLSNKNIDRTQYANHLNNLNIIGATLQMFIYTHYSNKVEQLGTQLIDISRYGFMILKQESRTAEELNFLIETLSYEIKLCNKKTGNNKLTRWISDKDVGVTLFSGAEKLITIINDCKKREAATTIQRAFRTRLETKESRTDSKIVKSTSQTEKSINKTSDIISSTLSNITKSLENKPNDKKINIMDSLSKNNQGQESTNTFNQNNIALHNNDYTISENEWLSEQIRKKYSLVANYGNGDCWYLAINTALNSNDDVMSLRRHITISLLEWHFSGDDDPITNQMMIFSSLDQLSRYEADIQNVKEYVVNWLSDNVLMPYESAHFSWAASAFIRKSGYNIILYNYVEKNVSYYTPDNIHGTVIKQSNLDKNKTLHIFYTINHFRAILVDDIMTYAKVTNNYKDTRSFNMNLATPHKVSKGDFSVIPFEM